MDIPKLLQHIGLAEKEAAVYLAALELGESSISDLARAAGLKRSTTYLDIEGLQVKGLLSETMKGKRKAYSAVHPRRLLDMVQARERQLEEVLPEMVAVYNTSKSKPKIQVFEGEEGVRLVYSELYQSLSRREEALWFANTSAIKKHFPFAVSEFKRIARKVKDAKIRELNYDEPAARIWQKESKQFRGKNHKQRLLKTEDEFGLTDNLIFGNRLVIFSFRKETHVIVIESEEVAKTYRALFNVAWRAAK